MRNRRSLALLLLFGFAMPAMACNTDPVGPRVPEGQDEDDDTPDENDDTAFRLIISSDPVVV